MTVVAPIQSLQDSGFLEGIKQQHSKPDHGLY